MSELPPNPVFQPTGYSKLRLLPPSAELQRYVPSKSLWNSMPPKKHLLIALFFILFVNTANAEIIATTEERLKSCDPKVAISAAEEVTKGKDHLQEPVLLLKAASTFFQNGRKDDAVFWYYAGHLRTRQQMAVDKGRGRDGFVEVVSTSLPTRKVMRLT